MTDSTLRCAHCGISLHSDMTTLTCPECGLPLEVDYPGLRLRQRNTADAGTPSGSWTPLTLGEKATLPFVSLPSIASSIGHRVARCQAGVHQPDRLLQGPGHSRRDSRGQTVRRIRGRRRLVGERGSVGIGIRGTSRHEVPHLCPVVGACKQNSGRSLPMAHWCTPSLGRERQLPPPPPSTRPSKTWYTPLTFSAPTSWKERSCLPTRYSGSPAGAFRKHIVMPVGNGSLLLGALKGFSELKRGGHITEIPCLHAVQAKNVMPIVAAFKGLTGTPPTASTVAGGIAVGTPARLEEIVAAIKTTDGTATAVEENDILSWRDTLAQTEGVYGEPTSAAAFAGLAQLVRAGNHPPRRTASSFQSPASV